MNAVLPLGTILTTAGLISDIVGAGLLYCFALPDDLRRGGRQYLELYEPEKTQRDAQRAARFDRWARVGVLLLILGFVGQLLGVWLPLMVSTE